ncbi:MAG TPA: ubiquinone biosynthesis protein UbiB [Clostridiales bacterium]|nr:ubiquinone biosynthesis protein UbiB [Clostridiales bacterium]
MSRRIHTDYKILKRYKEIGEVLVKYGFGFLIEKLYDKRLVPFRMLKRRSDIVEKMSPGKRIRLALEELGPTFIKLGQILSTRTDIIPESITQELSMLQDHAPEFSFSIVQELFEKEIGVSIQEAFEDFEEKPIAAASIGQVHQARLKDGSEVVVKIQRPNIENTIKRDMNILKTLAKILDEYFGDQIPFRMADIVEEFSYAMMRELNYMIEARNTEKFRENFKNDLHVVIPKVYWEYSTSKVLTLEKIKGIKLSNILKTENGKEDVKSIAAQIVEAFMKQIFIFGFFHADPHPGNIFVMPENRIAFIDFGITGYLEPHAMDFITDLFIAGTRKDIEKIADLFVQIDAVNPKSDMRRLKEDLSFIFNFYFDVPLKRLNISEALSEFMRITYQNRIRLPSQFVQLTRALIVLEGSIKNLDPELNVSEAAGPFVNRIIAYRFRPEKIFKEILYYGDNILGMLKTFPKDLRNIIKKLERNEMKFLLEETTSQKIVYHLHHTIHKLCLSLIIAAISISSSMLIGYEKGPMLFGISAFGLLGYFIALLSAVVLVFNILMTKFKK